MIRDRNIRNKLLQIRTFLRIMGVKPHFFAVTVFSSFLIAFFDGLSVGLLIPLAKGIIARDFTFIEKAPVFATIIAKFPNLFAEAPAKFIFISLVGIIFTAAITKNVLKYLSGLYIKSKKELFSLRLKQFIFNRYLTFGKLFFDRTSQGHITGTIGFASQIGTLFDVLNSTLINLFTLAIYLAIMTVISWKLTLLALIIFPVSHYSVTWVIKKIKKTARLQTDTALRLSREVFNILSCIALVKAYDKEWEAKKKFTDISDQQRRLNFSMAKKRTLIGPIQEIITLLGLIILVSGGSYILMKTQIRDVSGFLVFLYLLRRSTPIMGLFNSARASLAALEAPIEKVSGVLHDRNKFFVPSGKRIFSGLKRNIEFRNTSFSYVKGIPVLKDVNFSFEKGRMTAIVGPTGAGKTTILSLIMRFYDCRPSTIFLDDVDIREFTQKSLKKHKALVSQDILLLNDTLRNNIVFGMERKVAKEELISAVEKASLYHFATNLPDGFDTEVGDRGVKLSGGEKQRVAIARALVKEADILILDEATSSLDTKTEKEIQKAIEEVVKGRTTIVVAHRLSTIKNADKIIAIESGRIVEQGTLDELLRKKGKFYRYWQEQRFY